MRHLLFGLSVALLTCFSAQANGLLVQPVKAMWLLPEPTPKPALPASKLKVGQSSQLADLHVMRNLESWPNDTQTSYSLFGDEYRSVNVDLSVGLKPKRIMSLEAKW
ncbi:MAG: hypothetical protein AAF221_02430 [Pseudomonadota bacterium]